MPYYFATAFVFSTRYSEGHKKSPTIWLKLEKTHLNTIEIVFFLKKKYYFVTSIEKKSLIAVIRDFYW